jgi:hypothetical protein
MAWLSKVGLADDTALLREQAQRESPGAGVMHAGARQGIRRLVYAAIGCITLPV